jgi:hypothetical protein
LTSLDDEERCALLSCLDEYLAGLNLTDTSLHSQALDLRRV